MDTGPKQRRPMNPRFKANWFSILTFGWTLETFLLGYSRDITENDLYKPLPEHKSDMLGDTLEKAWKIEIEQCSQKQNKVPSLKKALMKVFGADLMLYGLILAAMEFLIRLQQPLFLGLLLRHYSPVQELYNVTADYSYFSRFYNYYEVSNRISWWEAVFFSCGVVFCSMINVVVQHPFMMGVMHLGMKIRIAVCSLIYRKTLRVNLQSMSESGGGLVLNLLANDVNRFDTGPLFIHYLWIAPLEMLIMTFYLYREFGMAAVYGVSTIVAVVPFQIFLGSRTATYRRRTATKSDERVRLMDEIVMGIEVIKMYTWEQPFRKIVDSVRRQEMHYIKRCSTIRGIIMSFIMFTTRFSIFLTVLLYVMYVNRITVENVFFLTCFYNIMKQTMTVFFPQAVSQIAEMNVAIQRVREFLLSEDCLLPYRKPSDDLKSVKIKPKKHVQIQLIPVSGPAKRLPKPVPSTSSSAKGEDKFKDINERGAAIIFNGASSRWLKSSSTDDAINVGVHIKQGSLTTIIGAVGSGKSTLLHMILSELPCTSGTVAVNGTLSYACQNPWLFVGSVRQNILFGQPFVRSRYMEVCKVCALERDISMFPHGDKTIVGERGVSLSGGQRARINLARAIYKEADIYLLDDPLSAVDTLVARHIFDNCIKRYLEEKTIVLVTHQIQFTKYVDHIIVMDKGTVEAEGQFDELNKRGLAIMQTMQDKTSEIRPTDVPATKQSKLTLIASTAFKSFHRSRWSMLSNMEQKREVEFQSTGRVQCSVYKKYFLADNAFFFCSLVLFLFVLAQFCASASDYWISQWSDAEEHLTGDATMDYLLWQQYGIGRKYFALIFGILTVATIVVALIRAYFFFVLCMKSSIKLHDNMFDCVVNSPMSFFHANPTGRILNRFSKDMGAIDELLPQAMLDCFQILLNLAGVIIVILITEVTLLIPIATTLMIFFFFRMIYIKTTSAIKRLDGITRSPVFGHLNATVLGLPTIRAFEAELLLAKEFDRHQDLHSAAWYLFISCSRGFGYYLDVVCLLFIICVTFSYLLKNDIEGSKAGLVITQSISLTGIFQWGMRQSAEMENQMTSVERVLEYTKLTREISLNTKPERNPPVGWPSEGAIRFDDLSLRYTPDGDEVLHKLRFNILPEEKIGVVGRTGAGKSSIIQALFRLAYLDGTIVIDNIDIKTIYLKDLRQKISIIPQEPVLFSGTLRKNLDPFDEHPNQLLLQALQKVELLDEEKNDDPLNIQVTDYGCNFSVGERQLVCLARAIVNKDRILLLDEATANVDAQTDALIQTAIREHFRTCTVLTIAHRLNTVIDSDKILVLDSGHLVEYDHPHILLQNKKGYFRKMVAETGSTMSQLLHTLAADNFKKTKEDK